MSLFAKIMVVVNLILAVAFLAAAGTFLNATQSWKAKHDTVVETTTTSIADLKAQAENQQQQKDTALAAKGVAEGRANSAEDKLQMLQDSNATLNSHIAALESSQQTLANAQGDLQTKNSELQGIIENQRGQLSTSESEKRAALDRVATLEESLASSEQAAADANSAAAAQEAANKGLTDQNDALATRIAMMENEHGASSRQPMKRVDGVVQKVDNENDIYILSVGQSDGVQVGYEFTVSRGNEYIATIVVDKVFKNHASARTKSGLKRKAAQSGDSAATHL